MSQLSTQHTSFPVMLKLRSNKVLLPLGTKLEKQAGATNLRNQARKARRSTCKWTTGSVLTPPNQLMLSKEKSRHKLTSDNIHLIDWFGDPTNESICGRNTERSNSLWHSPYWIIRLYILPLNELMTRKTAAAKTPKLETKIHYPYGN